MFVCLKKTTTKQQQQKNRKRVRLYRVNEMRKEISFFFFFFYITWSVVKKVSWSPLDRGLILTIF